METLEIICDTIDVCKMNALESFDLKDSLFWLERAKEWNEKLGQIEIAPIKEC